MSYNRNKGMGWIIIDVVTSDIFGQFQRNTRHGIQKGDYGFISDQDVKNDWHVKPKVFQMLRDVHTVFYEYAKYKKDIDLANYQFVLINKNNESVASVDIREEYTYYKKK